MIASAPAPSTAFVLVTDAGYFPKAARTVADLRAAGAWDGDVALLSVGAVSVGGFCETNWIQSSCTPWPLALVSQHTRITCNPDER